MRLKKIVLGLSAVAAAAILSACSSGSSASTDTPSLAANTGNTSSAATSTTTTTTLPPTTTTTTVAPPTTTIKPVTTAPATTKAPVQATEDAATGVPCHITTGACVSLSDHEAWILQDGNVIYGPVHAEGGRKGWTTPIGSFHVLSKSVHYVSHEFHVPMPYAVFFYPGDAFHEGSASTPSHGCVHLSLSAAETFYRDLSIGEQVQIVR